MYKIAVIGAGIISDYHAQGWQNIPDIEIDTVVDLDEKLAKEKASKWGAKYCTSDYKNVLENPEIEIVDICLPHFLHTRVTIDALNAGKNVLCEKPISLTIEEALEVMVAEKTSGKLLMIGENWYYIPVIKKAYEVYKSGEIGEAYNFRANLDFPGQRISGDKSRSKGWRGLKNQSGGGILIDAGVHSLSVGRWLMGEPLEVIGRFGRQLSYSAGLEDSFSAMINFESGATGLFHFAEPSGYPGSFDFKILGDKGVIEIDIFKELVTVVNAEGRKEFSMKAKGGMTEEMEHFIDCLKEGKKPVSSSDDQIKSLALVLSAYESANQNGIPVKVDKILNGGKGVPS